MYLTSRYIVFILWKQKIVRYYCGFLKWNIQEFISVRDALTIFYFKYIHDICILIAFFGFPANIFLWIHTIYQHSIKKICRYIFWMNECIFVLIHRWGANDTKGKVNILLGVNLRIPTMFNTCKTRKSSYICTNYYANAISHNDFIGNGTLSVKIITDVSLMSWVTSTWHWWPNLWCWPVNFCSLDFSPFFS